MATVATLYKVRFTVQMEHPDPGVVAISAGGFLYVPGECEDHACYATYRLLEAGKGFEVIVHEVEEVPWSEASESNALPPDFYETIKVRTEEGLIIEETQQ